jgi:very-short-patch-repair endonuclease
MRADAARSMGLREQGYSVLRFWNGEVTQNLEGVLDTIYAAVRQAETGKVRAGTPSPSPQGEGERVELVR